MRRSIPTAEAHVRDFYAYEGAGGTSFEFEQALSRHESAVAPVLQGILDREPKERRLLTQGETDALREFVALMFTRTPAGRKYDAEHAGPAAKRLLTEAAKEPQKFAEMVKDVHDENGTSEQELSEAIENARQRILSGFFDEPEPPEMRLYAMLNTARMIAEELRQYNCLIVIAPKHESFLTGDNPIVTATETDGRTQLGTAFASPNNAVWFPIAKELCLVWRRGIEPGYGRLPSRGVRMVNRNAMRFAERFVYGSTYSSARAEEFTRIGQEIKLGVNAFLPIWEGKLIEYEH